MAGLAGGLFAGLRGTIGAADFQLFNSLPLLLLAVVCGVTSVTGAALGGVGLMLLPVLQSYRPELAGLVFAVLGFGAVALGRDPNGLANLLFGLGRRAGPQFGAASARRPGCRCPVRRPEDVERHDESRRGRCPPMPLLEVDDVVVQFGGVTAVNHAGFAAEAGRITGLIGPNGAGKTTCFNVITGLQKPTQGKVRFDGRDDHPAARCTGARAAGWRAPSSGWRRSAR